MARVVVNDECIDIRVSMLERMVLSERSRRVPLSRVRSVNPHPPLLDMMVHWADQGNVWLGGVSAYEGHMIPSTRNPKSTLSIDVEDEPRVFVEVDGESTERVAERISRAMASQPPPAPDLSQQAPNAPQATPFGARAEPHASTLSSRAEPRASTSAPAPASEARISQLALELARVKQMADEEAEEDDHELARQRRDPLGQGGYGSLPPPAEHLSVPAPPLRLDDDHDLARLGGWLLALGSFGVVTGAVIVAAGAIPGLLAVGAGVICGVFGGVALAVVAHHQG